MTHDDYQATGINAFWSLETLLKTRRDMLQTLINTVDTSGHKVIAYGALKAARLHFDKAVLDELQKILVSKQIHVKPKMTAEQHLLWKFFHNSLCDLEAHMSHYLHNHGRDNYLDMINNIRERGFALLADYKNQFVGV